MMKFFKYSFMKRILYESFPFAFFNVVGGGSIERAWKHWVS